MFLKSFSFKKAGAVIRRLRGALANQPLKRKVQLLIGSVAVSLVLCFSFGMFLISRAANRSLQQSAAASLSSAGKQVANQLDALVDDTFLILADSTVQSSLAMARTRDENYIQYRRSFEAMHNIVQYYQTRFDGSHLNFIGIINDYYASFSTSPYVSSLPQDVTDALSAAASSGSGAPVFVTDYMDTYGLFLVREILEIDDLSLRSLGFMVLCIDFPSLVRDATVYGGRYSQPDYSIFDGERLLYTTVDGGAPSAHDFKNEDHLIDRNGGAASFVVGHTIALTGWQSELSVPYSEISRSVYFSCVSAVLVLAAVLSAVLLTAGRLLDAITARAEQLVEKMQRFGSNYHDLPQSSPDGQYSRDELSRLDYQFGEMARQLCTLIDKNFISELLRKDAELDALEKQINPHFLYNTLESVNWRAKAIGETQISAMTEALGRLLRITLNKSTDNHILKTELALVQDFMTIQNIRFENQLEYEQEVSAGAELALIPKLTVQPLVENAVHYGMESGEGVCRVRLRVTLEGKTLRIEVKNTGSQFPEDFYSKLEQKQYTSQGHGIGLLNIDQRLRINFGDEYKMLFYNQDDWAAVELRLPYFPLK